MSLAADSAALDTPIPVEEWASGHRASQVIVGCWQLAADHGTRAPDFDDLCRRWEIGIEVGLTTFDCADIYTGVEELLGRFSRRLARPESIQVHTKFVPDRAVLAELDGRRVEEAIDRSLRRLGRPALDLVQFHWWDYEVPGYVETALRLDELRRAGKIRHVGLTNFDLEHSQEILAAGVEIASVQVQYSVLDRRPADRFAGWCREHGIALLAYGSLAGGFLTDAYLGREQPGQPENRSLAKYRLIIDEFGGWGAFQEALSALAQIGGEVGQGGGAAITGTALRWTLDREAVAGVIVGTGRRNRIADYQHLGERGAWQAANWAVLEEVLARRPGPRGSVYGLERDPKGKHLGILKMNSNFSRSDGDA